VGRLVRIGIDVGGTFTKAVLLDNDTHEIIGQAVVPTTHTAEAGVAAGVIEAFRRALDSARITAAEVVFIRTARPRRPMRCSRGTWRRSA